MTEICQNTAFCKGKSKSEKLTGNKVHFVYVLLKIRNKALLFALTLIPLFFAGKLSINQLLTAILLQLLTLSAVLAPALISRHYIRWEFDGKRIHYQSGVFSKKQHSVSITNVRSVSIAKTPFLSLFRAVRLDIRCSDGMPKPDISLLMPPSQAEFLSAKLMRPSAIVHTLIPRTAPFLLMSASRANFAVGLSIASAFIFSLAGNYNDSIPETAYDKLSETAKLILPYLPPLLSVFIACFLLGWTVHFLRLCFGDARQVTKSSKDCIVSIRGLISSRLVCIKRNSISACYMKETLLSSLFRQCSIYVSYCGQSKKSTPLVLNAWHLSDFDSACHDLTGINRNTDTTVNISPNAHLILWLPYVSAAAVIAVLWFRFFISSPDWFYIFSFAAAAIFILLLWKCAVGISGAGKIKLSLSGQHINITAVRLFSIYTQKIYLGKIARFEIRQTILQKYRNLCTVYIKAAGEAKGLRCTNLPYDVIFPLSERIK